MPRHSGALIGCGAVAGSALVDLARVARVAGTGMCHASRILALQVETLSRCFHIPCAVQIQSLAADEVVREVFGLTRCAFPRMVCCGSLIVFYLFQYSVPRTDARYGSVGWMSNAVSCLRTEYL